MGCKIIKNKGFRLTHRKEIMKTEFFGRCGLSLKTDVEHRELSKRILNNTRQLPCQRMD